MTPCIASFGLVLASVSQVPAAPVSKSPEAKTVIAQAVAKAKHDGKQVMLMFSASWCVPCHMTEAALRKPNIASIYDKYYLFVKLDSMDGKKRPDLENDGADELMEQYFGKHKTMPAFAILDDEGKLRTNFLEETPNGDIERFYPLEGYPLTAHLLRILHAATPKFKIDDFIALRKILEAADNRG